MKADRFWILLLMVMLVITGVADLTVEHGLYLWIFSLVIWYLLRSIRSGGVSWFYMFMVVFFVLGVWLKVVFHHMFYYPFIEPTGGFEETIDQWKEYYIVSTLLAFAFVAAKKLYRLMFGIFRENLVCRGNIKPVSWLEWISIVCVVAVFYAINNNFAFFVTGVNPKLVLPLSLNAPLAFMAVIGIAVVVSVYVSRDFYSNGYLTTSAAVVILFVSALASVSMASRAAIIMQGLPMLIAAMNLQVKYGTRKIDFKPIAIFGLVLGMVLILVSIYRINVFMSASALDEGLLEKYFNESLGLIVDRWIGAEAIMVGVSEGGASFHLMKDLVLEDPTQGSNAIYQILSGSKYKSQEGFTFLTLPGFVGILALSGSSLIVFLGSVIIFFSGLCFERFVRWAMFGQDICVAIVCAALANAITQISFPRLLIPFVFQMVVLLLVINVAIRHCFHREKLFAGIDRYTV